MYEDSNTMNEAREQWLCSFPQAIQQYSWLSCRTFPSSTFHSHELLLLFFCVYVCLKAKMQCAQVRRIQHGILMNTYSIHRHRLCLCECSSFAFSFILDSFDFVRFQRDSDRMKPIKKELQRTWILWPKPKKKRKKQSLLPKTHWRLLIIAKKNINKMDFISVFAVQFSVAIDLIQSNVLHSINFSIDFFCVFTFCASISICHESLLCREIQ